MNKHEVQKKFLPENNFGLITKNHSIMINKWNMPLATGLNLEREYSTDISRAFVIKGPNYQQSIDSALHYGLNVTLLDSFNVLDNVAEHLVNGEYTNVVLKHIVAPSQYRGAQWLDHLKIVNINLTYRQVTRLLNHIAIWEECARVQEPYIILDNGAQLTLHHTEHLPRNSIISLDSGIKKFYQHNTNFLSMNNPHAYSIDQFMAKRLFSDIMKNGMIEPLERHFRVDKYLIIPNNKASV